MVADGLEITQAVQDLANSVRLVAGKQTYIRFHVHASEGEYPTTAKLRVDDGRSVRELLPINPRGEIIVRPGPSRDAINDSFLFYMPSGLLEGRVTFTGELNPNNSPAEENRDNNTFTDAVTFETVPAANLIVYPVKWGPAGNQHEASDLHLTKLSSWLRRAYPISYLHFSWRRAHDAGAALPTCERVNAALSWTRLWDVHGGAVAPTTRYYGMVYDGGTVAGFMRGCAMDIPSFVASGPTGDRGFSWDKDGSYGDWYGGHELAHTWGRRHPGFCDQDRDPGGPPYPYPGGKISPAAAGVDAFFGFDIETRDIYRPTWTDLMSYCNYEWVSDFLYEGLMDRFQSEGGPAAAAAAAARESTQTDRLLVVGSIDPATNHVELQPLFVLPAAGELTQRVPGAYAIVLRNASGVELARYAFTPHESQVEAFAPDGDQSAEALTLFIEEVVPFVAGTTRVDIEGPSGLQHTVTAGANPPTVHITAPSGGAILDGPTIEVAWTAADVDGDPLAFTVQYSPDNGASWQVVAQNPTGDHVDLDARDVPGGPQARFRVWASDGMHTASDESQTVVVPNRIPTITITEPAAAVTIAAGQTLGLRADAYDVDSGSMNEEVQWVSDRDGVLGSGAWLGVLDLSVGVHTVTARADDGKGGAATDTVQVTVVGDLSELPPVPDTLSTSPSLISFDPDNGQTSFTLRIENENIQQAIAWQAAANTAWVQLSAATGTTPAEITVSFKNTGLTAGHHSAAITISSDATPGQAKTIGVEVTIAQQPTTACTGDCNNSNTVTVDELLKGVNIALGTMAMADCTAFDANGDGKVTVDELIRAVNYALTGCELAPATPTKSVSPTIAPSVTSLPTQPPSATTAPTTPPPPPTATLLPTATTATTPSPTPTKTPPGMVTPSVLSTSTRTPPGSVPTATSNATPSGHLYCHTLVGGLPIPDDDPVVGAEDAIVIPDAIPIAALTVDVDIDHPWVGDLVVTLDHLEELSWVTLINRPGASMNGVGCGGDNIRCTLDDRAAQPVDDQCSESAPAINGTFRPNDALSTFTGESSAGTWVLTVRDEGATDTGNLLSWCLEVR